MNANPRQNPKTTMIVKSCSSAAITFFVIKSRYSNPVTSVKNAYGTDCTLPTSVSDEVFEPRGIQRETGCIINRGFAL